MNLAIRLRSRRLAILAAATLVVASSPLITAVPASATVPNPTLNCQAESFPTAGTPRGAAPKPFEAQFAATLEGGFLSVHVPGHLGVTFGVPQPAYPTGTLFGEACGVVNLPSLQGPIADSQPGAADNNPGYNHSFILHGPSPGCTFRYVNATDTQPTRTGCDGQKNSDIVPVGLTVPGLPQGLPAQDGYGSADGTINTAILSPAAANGGFNVTFSNTAKATAVLDPAALLQLLGGPALVTLGLPQSVLDQLIALLALPAAPGGECTLAVGDLSQTGDPTYANKPTPPVHLSTDARSSIPVPPATGLPFNGKPVTGPASAGTQPITPTTAGSAVAFANNFPAPAIDSNMPPDPGAPNATAPDGTPTPPSTLCNTVVAQAFSAALGLPAQPGDVTFSAPVGFSAHAAK